MTVYVFDTEPIIAWLHGEPVTNGFTGCSNRMRDGNDEGVIADVTSAEIAFHVDAPPPVEVTGLDLRTVRIVGPLLEVARRHHVDMPVQHQCWIPFTDRSDSLGSVLVRLVYQSRLDVVRFEPVDDELRSGSLVARWVFGLDSY